MDLQKKKPVCQMINKKERPNTKQVVTVFFFFSFFIPNYRDLFSYNINPKFRIAFIYLFVILIIYNACGTFSICFSGFAVS